VVGAVATVCAEHAAEPHGALAASSAAVLRALAADRENSKVILAAGGARGLAQLALGAEGAAGAAGAEGAAGAPGAALSWNAQRRAHHSLLVQADARAALALLEPEVCGRFVEQMRASPLLKEPTFWTEPVCGFLTARAAKQYPTLVATAGDFFFELYHFCALLTLRQGRADNLAPADAAKDITGALEVFEIEPAALRFMSGIFGDVTARARVAIADFDTFEIAALGDIAHLGVEVLNRVRGLTLAEQALRGLYQRYLRDERPDVWKQLFKEGYPFPYPHLYPYPYPYPHPYPYPYPYPYYYACPYS